jgi:hypothetical protein
MQASSKSVVAYSDGVAMSIHKFRLGFLMVLGLVGFGNVSRMPRFASFHTVDVLQLLVSGMCFGVVLTGLVANRRPNVSK